MHKHKTDFASVLGYPTAGVNCFADWRLRGEMMGSLQEYLLGVVDDAGCRPYGCRKNADRIRVENSYPARLPQPLFDRGPIARGFFLSLRLGKKGQLESVFLCFNAHPRSSQNQAALATGLEGAGTRGRDFQHYVRS